MNIINELPAGGSLKAELLWTNPNPGSQTGEFTVNINLSNYTAVIVRMRGYYNESNYDWTIALKGWGTQWLGVHVGTSGTRLNGRRVTVTDSGVTFTNGFVGASGNNDQRAAIPMKIYGVKVEGITG